LATAWLLLALVIVLIALNGFFVMAEFALVTVDRPAVRRAADQGDARAASVQKALTTLSTQLSGCQLGITITSLVVGLIAEPSIATLLRPVLHAAGLGEGAAAPISVGLAFVLATLSQMVFSELVPKNWALAEPLRLARWIAAPQLAFATITRPLLRFFNGTANKVVRSFGIEPQEELASARSPQELAGLVQHSAKQGALAAETAELVARSFAFGDRRARDVMTPRARIHDLTPDTSVAQMLAAATESGFSRFPVIEEDEGKVLGLVHVRHSLSIPYEQRATTPVSSVMGPVTVVPDTVELDHLMDTLRSGGLQLAVLVDEFGDTAGLVTLEDLVEELVGEVLDEHDPQGPSAVQAADGSWVLDALLRPDEASEYLGACVPEHEDYETLAGLVTLELERLAQVGDEVSVAADNPHGVNPATIVFRVEETDEHRIVRVRAVVTHHEPVDAEDGAEESEARR